MQHCADVNLKSNLRRTPLIRACASGSFAVVRLLCDAPGIDLAARDVTGDTVLSDALGRREGHADITAFLRSRGAPE